MWSVRAPLDAFPRLGLGAGRELASLGSCCCCGMMQNPLTPQVCAPPLPSLALALALIPLVGNAGGGVGPLETPLWTPSGCVGACPGGPTKSCFALPSVLVAGLGGADVVRTCAIIHDGVGDTVIVEPTKPRAQSPEPRGNAGGGVRRSAWNNTMKCTHRGDMREVGLVLKWGCPQPRRR